MKLNRGPSAFFSRTLAKISSRSQNSSTASSCEPGSGLSDNGTNMPRSYTDEVTILQVAPITVHTTEAKRSSPGSWPRSNPTNLAQSANADGRDPSPPAGDLTATTSRHERWI